jgi:hypothetical protein
MDEAPKAVDAPTLPNGGTDRHGLLRSVQRELEICWSNLMLELPPERDVDLAEDTAAGRKFKELFIRLWTAARLLERSKDGDGNDVASSANLVSRVRTAARDHRRGVAGPGGKETCRRIHGGYHAWWRPGVTRDGEDFIALAMRHTLSGMGQIPVELPGVSDQASLTRLGVQYGVIDPDPPVSGFLAGGRERLAVLMPRLGMDLLEEPTEELNGELPSQ